MQHLLRSKKGFTLVELLVVIAIIAILSTTVFIAVNPSRIKARDARRFADMEALSAAIIQYQDDHGNNAPSGVVGQQLACLTGLAACADPDISYISRLPVDPTNSGAYMYTYANTGNDRTYYIQFRTEGPATNIDPAATGASGNTFCKNSTGIEFLAANTTSACALANEK